MAISTQKAKPNGKANSAKNSEKQKRNETLHSPLIKQKGVKGFFLSNMYIILTFLFGFAIMLTAFGVMDVAPFGKADKQILVVDLWHQYFPFLNDLQDKLQNGRSLFWTWSVGAGTNYFALISYYLASPLNLLTVFVPSEHLREFLMFSVSLKIALSGTFTAIFLRTVFKKNDMSLMMFGLSFSFCAFFMGYYWNTIWLDTVCISPLVALGAVMLLKENRFRLYTVTLALTMITNYYIGFFICIFVFIIFVVYNIIKWKNIQRFVFDLAKIALFSILGIGLATFILIPTVFALQNTYATGSTFPKAFAINIGSSNDLLGVLGAMKSIVANLMNFTCAATKEADAIPNISCGAVTTFFALLFLTSKRVRPREKVVSFCVIAFMMVSCVIRQLDYIWHGLHFTNMIPYRFAFLISFVMIVMAFKAFTEIDRITPLQVIFSGLCSAVILVLTLGDQSLNTTANSDIKFDKGLETQFKSHLEWIKPTIFTAIILLVIVFLVVFLYSKRILPKMAMAIVLVLLVIGQSSVSAIYSVKVTTVTSTNDYPRGEKKTEQLIEYMNDLEKDNNDLWRAETTSTQTLNDGALNNYRGLSMFNSLTNVNMTILYENLGMMGWKSGNRYTYAESSPVTNMIMNLKYLISRDGSYANTYDLSSVYDVMNEKLLLNNHYIPMGFMANKSLADWEVYVDKNSAEDITDPFAKQNEFFRLATGLNDNVYTEITPSSSSQSSYSYTAPKDGLYCFYAKITGGDNATVSISSQYKAAQSKSVNMGRPYIAAIGYADKGDTISITLQASDNNQTPSATIYTNVLNEDVFEKGYQILSQSVMEATKTTDSSVEGTINAKNDGLFYTSIPYEEGWTAEVDGEKVEITPVGNALIAFPLSKGEHTIKIYYYPHGFWIGAAVTAVCVLAFAFLCFYIYIYKKRMKKKIIIADEFLPTDFLSREDSDLK